MHLYLDQLRTQIYDLPVRPALCISVKSTTKTLLLINFPTGTIVLIFKIFAGEIEVSSLPFGCSNESRFICEGFAHCMGRAPECVAVIKRWITNLPKVARPTRSQSSKEEWSSKIDLLSAGHSTKFTLGLSIEFIPDMEHCESFNRCTSLKCYKGAFKSEV